MKNNNNLAIKVFVKDLTDQKRVIGAIKEVYKRWDIIIHNTRCGFLER